MYPYTCVFYKTDESRIYGKNCESVLMQSIITRKFFCGICINFVERNMNMPLCVSVVAQKFAKDVFESEFKLVLTQAMMIKFEESSYFCFDSFNVPHFCCEPYRDCCWVDVNS